MSTANRFLKGLSSKIFVIVAQRLKLGPEPSVEAAFSSTALEIMELVSMNQDPSSSV